MASAAAARARSGLGALAFVLFTLVLVAAAQLRQLANGRADGLPLDSDGWVRLLRVRVLWEGGGWYPGLLPYLSAPDGLSLHWTRPLDVLILVPAWAMARLAGWEANEALVWAGAIVCPALHLLTALAAGWAARIAWPGLPAAAYYAVLVLLGQDVLTGYSALGRADHHTLVVFAIVLGLGFALRAGRPAWPAGSAVAAGAAFGFGIWVSPESLMAAMPVLAAFGALWVLLRDGAPAAMQGLRIALGMAAMLMLAIAAERPPSDWLVVEYDRVSAHHLALALIVVAVFAAALRLAHLAPMLRLLGGAVLAGGAGASVLAAFPGTLGGSLSGADEASAALFLPVIQEMQPLRLMNQATVGTALLFVGAAPAALLGAFVLLWRGRRDGAWRQGMVLLFALLGTLVAAMAYRRFATNFAGVAAIAAGGLMGVVARLAWPVALRLPMLILVLALLFAPPLLGERLIATAPANGEPRVPADQRGCHARELTNWLLALTPADIDQRRAPIVIMSDLNHAAELAWRTRLRYVAGPYHRGGAAVVDMFALFQAETDEMAQLVLRGRGVGFIVLCPETFASEGAFARRLLADEVPDFLEAVPPPEGHQAGVARVYRVR